MIEQNEAPDLSEGERAGLARDLKCYEVTEKHTWLRTDDDIRAYIEHNFEDVDGNSLHAVKTGMDYTIYAWRTKARSRRLMEDWRDAKAASKVRFRKPRCVDGDFGVFVNEIYIGDVRKAHIPAWSPGYPSSGRHSKPAVNGWECIVEDEKAAVYKPNGQSFQPTRDAAAYQLWVCALDPRPFAVHYSTRIKRGHI